MEGGGGGKHHRGTSPRSVDEIYLSTAAKRLAIRVRQVRPDIQLPGCPVKTAPGQNGPVSASQNGLVPNQLNGPPYIQAKERYNCYKELQICCVL